jgi:hypothetical protein
MLDMSDDAASDVSCNYANLLKGVILSMGLKSVSLHTDMKLLYLELANISTLDNCVLVRKRYFEL